MAALADCFPVTSGLLGWISPCLDLFWKVPAGSTSPTCSGPGFRRPWLLPTPSGFVKVQLSNKHPGNGLGEQNPPWWITAQPRLLTVPGWEEEETVPPDRDERPSHDRLVLQCPEVCVGPHCTSSETWLDSDLSKVTQHGTAPRICRLEASCAPTLPQEMSSGVWAAQLCTVQFSSLGHPASFTGSGFMPAVSIFMPSAYCDSR